VKRLCLALVILLSGASVAAAQSLWSYNWTASATFDDQGRRFVAYINPKLDTILLQPSMRELFGGAKVVDAWPIVYWRHAAESFVGPVGCGISDVKHHGAPHSESWEATFVCPAGVDLRGLAAAQRAGLMRGEPLHP
jgi:hypothetical protein